MTKTIEYHAIEMIIEDSLKKTEKIEDVEIWVDNFASWHKGIVRETMVAEIMKQLPAYGYDEDFTHENLLQFEKDFFAVPTEYPHLRYGQAFTNIFGEILPTDIFYYDDVSECRTIVWQELGEK